MALNRLRRVLESQYSVGLISNPGLCERVSRKITAREQELLAKGRPAPVTKMPTTVPAIQAEPNWRIRAIDPLHKLGLLTTPAWLNMAQLSASWATRRYFWAVAEPDGEDPELRLSRDARLLDFHQKTLLSDEFGVAMAGLLLEQRFNAPSAVDISVALNDPSVYQDIDQVGTTQPDYLMWGAGRACPYYVVECKGSQTNADTSMDQLRRGLEQVPSVVFRTGGRRVISLVIATCMEEDRTVVYVIDPPPDDPPYSDDDEPDDSNQDKVSYKTGKRSWRIADRARFQKRTELATASGLLKWAGQFGTAQELDSFLVERHQASSHLPNLPLESKQTPVGAYKGFFSTPFPELGPRHLRLFTGVEEQLLARAMESSAEVEGAAIEAGEQALVSALHPHSPYQSFSRNGTCMIIDGMQLG